MPSDLCECAFDVASGGKGFIVQDNENRFEALTLERGLCSDSERVQAVSSRLKN